MQVVFTALLLLPGASRVDHDQVRRVIQLPSSSLYCGVYISISNRGVITPPDANTSLPQEIAAAEKALRAGGDNPDIYRALADLYFRSRQKDKGQAAQARAAELYLQRLNAGTAPRPGSCVLLARRADCLPLRTGQEREEVEKLLRAAARPVPVRGESSEEHWEPWVLLGAHLEEKGGEVLTGGEESKDMAPPVLLEKRAREGKITPQDERHADECFAEALRCFDRAVALAHREPTAYLARAGFQSHRALNGMMRHRLRGQPPDAADCAALEACCADLWRAAELAPDDFPTTAAAAFFEVMLWGLKKAQQGPDRNDLPVASEAVVQGALARIERLGALARLEKAADKSDPFTAGRALEMLALFHLQAGDLEKMERRATQAVRICPDLEQAWELRIGALLSQKKTTEVLVASRERVRHKPSARNCFLLAKACDDAKQPAEAIEVLEDALRREPDDLLCNLSLAALLMKRDDRELKRVGQLLERADRTMQKRPTEDDMRNCAALWIAYWALDGQEDLARLRLVQLSAERQADVRLKDLSRALGLTGGVEQAGYVPSPGVPAFPNSRSTPLFPGR